MYVVYWIIRFYPYWSLPLGLVIFELGNYFIRRSLRGPAKTMGWSFRGIGVLMGIGIIFWFIFRGDLNSDAWVRGALE